MNPNGKALLKENKRYYLLDSLRGISTVSTDLTQAGTFIP